MPASPEGASHSTLEQYVFLLRPKKTADHVADGKEAFHYWVRWKDFWGNHESVRQDDLVDDVDNTIAGHHISRSNRRTIYRDDAVGDANLNVLTIDRSG